MRGKDYFPFSFRDIPSKSIQLTFWVGCARFIILFTSVRFIYKKNKFILTSITPLLASSLGRRDEKPNIDLARNIVQAKNRKAIDELIQLCQGRERKLAADAIKVIYEIGYVQPALIKDLVYILLDLLNTKHNRLQWGAMTALNTLGTVCPGELYQNTSRIIDTMHTGTVITKDAGVKLLVELASDANRSQEIIPILLEFIQDAPLNQFPTYCQRIGSLPLGKHAHEFAKIIRSRLPEFEAYPPKHIKLMFVLNQLGV